MHGFFPKYAGISSKFMNKKCFSSLSLCLQTVRQISRKLRQKVRQLPGVCSWMRRNATSRRRPSERWVRVIREQVLVVCCPAWPESPEKCPKKFMTHKSQIFGLFRNMNHSQTSIFKYIKFYFMHYLINLLKDTTFLYAFALVWILI